MMHFGWVLDTGVLNCPEADELAGIKLLHSWIWQKEVRSLVYVLTLNCRDRCLWLTRWRESWCSPRDPLSPCSRTPAPACRGSFQSCVRAHGPEWLRRPGGCPNGPERKKKGNRDQSNLSYSIQKPLHLTKWIQSQNLFRLQFCCCKQWLIKNTHLWFHTRR